MRQVGTPVMDKQVSCQLAKRAKKGKKRAKKGQKKIIAMLAMTTCHTNATNWHADHVQASFVPTRKKGKKRQKKGKKGKKKGKKKLLPAKMVYWHGYCYIRLRAGHVPRPAPSGSWATNNTKENKSCRSKAQSPPP
jgi:hypothetical protein